MGNLTKKDFIKIAEIINDNTSQIKEEIIIKESFIYDLCKYLKTTNRQFNEREFKKKCEVEKWLNIVESVWKNGSLI